MDATIPCKTCDRGRMFRTKVRRMPGAVVVLGFLLLIPSAIGLCIGGIGVLAGAFAASESKKTPAEVAAELQAAGVSQPLIDRLLAGEPIEPAELEKLPPAQSTAVGKAMFGQVFRDKGTHESGVEGGGEAGASGDSGATAEGDPALHDLGATEVIGGSLVIVIASLVGGFLSFVLISKRAVLQCTDCRAILPAA